MLVAGCSYKIKSLAGLLMFMATVLLSTGQAFAAYNVNISGNPSAGGDWSGTSPDVWTPSGAGANVSVAEIRARLNGGTGVSISTAGAGSDAGNININAATYWNAGTLTLTAHNDININSVMSASNTAGLAMNYGWNGNSGTPTYGSKGGLNVGFAPGEANGFVGRVDFQGSGLLTINGNSYTIIKNIFELQSISFALTGKYALGVDIDASETLGWNGGAGFLPIGDNSTTSDVSRFTGVFDGLGHSVNGLVINRPSTVYVGLFGYGLNANVRNVGLVGGNVSGSSFVGALAGYVEGVVNNCYNSGIVSGAVDNIGGIAGGNGASIANTYSIATVNGSGFVGGLVGGNYGGSINSSYATGTVTGTTDTAGGLVGFNFFNGSISNSYAVGSVFVSTSVGGLVGENYLSTISNSYSTGSVNDTTNAGGLVGLNDISQSVTNSFWDTITSGQTGSAVGSGKTTAEMKELTTFVSAGWDIDAVNGTGKIWRIYDGQTYPRLRTFVPPQSIVTGGSVTAITTDSATLNGTVNAIYADATVSFQYGTTTAYGTSAATTPATVTVGSGDTAVSAAISGLTPGQTYHGRVVATNGAGTVYGDDVVFTALQVILDNLNQTYDGSAKPVMVTTTPAGLAATVTYGGSTTVPIAAGTYTVVATINDGNYSGSASGILVISKAVSAVTLGNFNQTYDGSAKPVTVTTTPAGLGISVTYEGNATAPTAIGTYAVIATVTDANYQGSAGGTLVINPTTLTVALTANGTQPTGIGGTVTSSPAGISCANSIGGTLVTCTSTFIGTVNLYATPYALSTFGGWSGGTCSGLGPCSVTMSADKTVTATFNQATLLQIGGTPYPTLQAAYNAVSVSAVVQLLDNSVAGILDANRNVAVTLKGGYDVSYSSTPGTTVVTAPFTVRQGSVVIDRIVIK